jgi:uncharacterized protein
MRIFLDANILFSAGKSDGAARELLALLRASGHECCVDGYVVEEARRNLAAKAPAAMRLKCAALVTGGRTHFGALFGQTVHGVTIHLPRPLGDAVLGGR